MKSPKKAPPSPDEIKKIFETLRRFYKRQKDIEREPFKRRKLEE